MYKEGQTNNKWFIPKYDGEITDLTYKIVDKLVLIELSAKNFNSMRIAKISGSGYYDPYDVDADHFFNSKTDPILGIHIGFMLAKKWIENHDTAEIWFTKIRENYNQFCFVGSREQVIARLKNQMEQLEAELYMQELGL